MAGLYLGVDVGTSSVRAGLVDGSGRLVAAPAVREISRHSPAPGQYEQSSTEIWVAVCGAVRGALAGLPDTAKPTIVLGLGFTGTCSLVLVGPGDSVLQVGDSPDRDVIMWMDHRAGREAELITATRHPVLDSVGGAVSLEMQLPKLLWLKTHRPEVWAAAERCYDLPDWLVHRATNTEVRSLCSAVCKAGTQTSSGFFIT